MAASGVAQRQKTCRPATRTVTHVLIIKCNPCPVRAQGGTGGCFQWRGARVLGLGDLGRFSEGDGICTILHIETRARAAILTAAPASTPRHSPSCAHRCPAITCPCGGSRLSALSPGVLVAVALQDTTSITGIREPTTPKRNMARSLVHRTSFFVGSKSFPVRHFRQFAFCILHFELPLRPHPPDSWGSPWPLSCPWS